MKRSKQKNGLNVVMNGNSSDIILCLGQAE